MDSTKADQRVRAAPASAGPVDDPRLAEARAVHEPGHSQPHGEGHDGGQEELEVLDHRVAALTAGVWFCGGLLALYTLYIGRALFVPVTIAVFAYLTLRPLVRGASKVGVPAPISAAAVMIALALSLGIIFYLVSEPAKTMLNNAPQSLSIARERLAFVFDRLERVNEATEETVERADDESIASDDQPVPVQIRPSAWAATSPILAGTGNVLSMISIAAALLYFLMATGDDLLRKLTSAIPTFSNKRRFLEVIENVQDGLSSYLACVSVINACLGAAIGLAMWALGMPHPLLWGVAGMFLNFLPIFGALCGTAAAFFIALVSFEHPSHALLVGGTYAALTAFEGQFITPSILGKSMRLSSAVVFLSIVIWGWMWGVAGIFLAVPILLTLAMASEKIDALAPVAAVIGGPSPTPKRSVDGPHELESAVARE